MCFQPLRFLRVSPTVEVEFEVIGESTVLVLDARKARVEPRQPGQLSSARGITLRVLTAGMGFDCK